MFVFISSTLEIKTCLKALSITFKLTHIPNVLNVPVRIPVRIPALIQLQHKI